jgi:hypothetical protein
MILKKKPEDDYSNCPKRVNYGGFLYSPSLICSTDKHMQLSLVDCKGKFLYFNMLYHPYVNLIQEHHPEDGRNADRNMLVRIL